MTPEGIVVEEVVRYFSDPMFQKFSIEKEYPIQMGSDNRRADVVLVDSADRLVAVAECKRVGVEGHGLDRADRISRDLGNAVYRNFAYRINNRFTVRFLADFILWVVAAFVTAAFAAGLVSRRVFNAGGGAGETLLISGVKIFQAVFPPNYGGYVNREQ